MNQSRSEKIAELAKNCYQGIDKKAPPRDDGIIDAVCRICFSKMDDYERGGASRRPRFICTNNDCKMQIVAHPYQGGRIGYEFEQSQYKTAFWDRRHLANYAEYREAEIQGKISQLIDPRD